MAFGYRAADHFAPVFKADNALLEVADSGNGVWAASVMTKSNGGCWFLCVRKILDKFTVQQVECRDVDLNSFPGQATFTYASFLDPGISESFPTAQGKSSTT